jgi:hypothetical protein
VQKIRGVQQPPFSGISTLHKHEKSYAFCFQSCFAEGSPFILTVFHKGGTLTGDIQGESAFDPAATKPPLPPANVINSPESGVWQKTGWKTFAVTLLTIEYQVDPPNATFFQFDKVQFRKCCKFVVEPNLGVRRSEIYRIAANRPRMKWCSKTAHPRDALTHA